MSITDAWNAWRLFWAALPFLIVCALLAFIGFCVVAGRVEKWWDARHGRKTT